MTCPHCVDADSQFGRKRAQSDLDDYHRSGPAKTTHTLLDAVRDLGVKGATLLDIGGGVGVIQHELMEAGLARSIDVDASSAYIAVARQEAQERGYADRATYLHGDFVQFAEEIGDVDVVTLDRAICCYPDVHALVSKSAQKAGRVYAAVFPVDAWYTRLLFPVANLFFWVQRSAFRIFVHDSALVHELITAQGLSKHTYQRGLLWQVVVYTRDTHRCNLP